MQWAMGINQQLRHATRLPALPKIDQQLAIQELGVLIGCGVIGALAMGFIPGSIPVPGHAILRATLPFAFGLAMVPRRSSGTIMAAAGGATCGILQLLNAGTFQFPAVVSLVALGPLLDLAMAGSFSGWRLHLRFVSAGVAANLVAFVVRMATAGPMAGAGGRRAMDFGWPLMLASFLACGFLAGLISAGLAFRAAKGTGPEKEL